ncbi:MAG TPA: hypothetical protein VGM27_15465 [Acidobacteriaceae bacterium]|jgi:hypothetical protein
MTLRKFWITSLLLTFGLSAAQAKQKYQPPLPLSPEQAALVQKAIAREKVTVREIQKHSPLVQTYIQNMKADQVLYAVPESDQYLLGRVDFAKSISDQAYAEGGGSSHGMFKGSMKYVSGLTKAFKMQYISAGFMEMMFLDPVSFDQQHYDFAYVRRDFLGSVRTLVFDVHPKPGTGNGRFSGRIWIEDQAGNIVRFNGTYTGGNGDDDSSNYFHFDSWRENLQPGLWLPVGVYVEETQKSDEHPVSFKAQTHIWGYSLKLPTHESDSESVKIDDVQDQSEQSQDLSPLQAQREWISQAEENVLDRLVQAGLLSPPSDFDKVLEQVANNIVIGNSIQLTDSIRCRVMLTAPLESLAVGNTIILSKGLVDVLPTEADLAAVLSFQLAHIVLGHHIDTRYAFNDRLLFPDEATFERIHMSHTDPDNELAATKAITLLNKSVYGPQLAQPGLFFEQLEVRAKELQALNTPRLGDSLLRPTGEPWLNGLVGKAPKLDMNKLDQTAALPLGSHLKIDSWSDKVISMHFAAAPILNARDKMPFEVTPVFFRLTRYEAAQAQQQAAGGAGAAATPAVDTQQGAAQASASTPNPN